MNGVTEFMIANPGSAAVVAVAAVIVALMFVEIARGRT